MCTKGFYSCGYQGIGFLPQNYEFHLQDIVDYITDSEYTSKDFKDPLNGYKIWQDYFEVSVNL